MERSAQQAAAAETRDNVNPSVRAKPGNGQPAIVLQSAVVSEARYPSLVRRSPS
ncbi:MAG: hypothetical protein IIA62_02485 [Nitrospinae bacterium]|nr:hypothetical protein [Nitrospinota bacterium]